MRRLVSIVLVLVMSFSLAACNKGGGGGGGTTNVTVDFDVNGGTGFVLSQTVKKGSLLTEPADPPAHATMLFDGWFTAATGGTKWNFSSDKAEDSFTLYAHYKARNNNYENEMEWSQSGYLYFHYYRFKNTTEDYDLWDVWAWPLKSEGKAFDWERYDDSGAVLGINLNETHKGGLTGVDINYSESDEIGFLIVLKSSKENAKTHWASDGSADTFLKDYKDHVRADGSIHVFITQGQVRNYSYTFAGTEDIEDPYEGIVPSEHVSVTNVNSSTTSFNKPATSKDFLENVGVGYTIFVASFADSNDDGFGDLQGIIQNLDYLDKTLNAKVLWLTPIQLSESYHGYDVVDYYQIDPRFGTMKDYRELIYKAHERGIRVLMDLVPNHSSASNIWFIKSRNLDPHYRSFYHWAYGDEYKGLDHWYPYSDTGFYFYGKFASSMPEFNYDYQGTRDAFVEVAKYWMSFGLDGFRLDAVKHIYNEGEYDPSTKGASDVIKPDPGKDDNYRYNLTKNTNFFREFSARVKETYPDAFLVGENVDGDSANLAPMYEGLDSQFSFKTYYDFTRDGFNRASNQNGGMWGVDSFISNLNLYHASRGDTAIDSVFTSNHDFARMLNLANSTFVGSASTPTIPTFGNTEAVKKAEVAAAVILTLPGVSWIYYGDELGMSGMPLDNLDSEGKFLNDYHADRHIRQAFKWDKAGSSTYTTDYSFEVYDIPWDTYNVGLDGVLEQLQNPSSTLNHYKKLTQLKNDVVMLRGNIVRMNGYSDKLTAFTRTYNGVTYKIFHNMSNSTVNQDFSGQILFQSNGATTTSLPPYSTIIVKA